MIATSEMLCLRHEEKMTHPGSPGASGVSWHLNGGRQAQSVTTAMVSPSAVPDVKYHCPSGDLCSMQKLHPVLASHWHADLLRAPDSHLNFDFYLIFHLTKQCKGEGVW